MISLIKQSPLITFASILAAVSLSSAVAAGEKSILDLDIHRHEVEGAARAPVHVQITTIEKDGQSEEGVALTLSHAKTYNSVRFPIESTSERFNVLSFKVTFDEGPLNFTVNVFDNEGKLHATRFNKYATKNGDGSYDFKWDMVNQPDNDQGADLTNIKMVALKFSFPDIPEGEERHVTVSGMRLISEVGDAGGDPILYEKWQQYVQAYRPDYSDSSSALFSPVNGRISPAIPVIAEGKALAEIVLPKGANEAERNAAKELQFWLKKITDTELPIVETSSDQVASIYLGRSHADSQYSSDLEKLGTSDGFAVRCDGRDFYIFGATPKGTLNGVFAFLENNTDIIWARPHDDYGAVYSKRPKLEIVWTDALELPGTVQRGWLQNSGGLPGRFSAWSIRNRANHTGGGKEWGEMTEIGGGHNLHSFIPKNDPAFFPVIDGKKSSELSIWKHQICLSAPNLVDIYADNVLKFLREKKAENTDIVNIKIEDNWGVCECEKCVAPITLSDGSTLDVEAAVFRSTQFYIFLNAVTKKLAETLPHLKVQTYAYFYTVEPPKVRLDERIYVLFCPYVRKDHRTPLYSPVNDHWWKIQKGWAQASPNVVVREYYGIFNEGRPLAEVVAEDVKVKIDQGIVRFTSETMDDDLRLWWDGNIRGAGDEHDVNMMEQWVITRLYWAPDSNVETLRKYFIRRAFHEAAPEMEKVFGIVREDWYRQRGISTWGSDALNRAYVASGKEHEVRDLLDSAIKKVENPLARILVARVKERIETRYLQKPIPLPKAENVEGKQYFPLNGLLHYGWSLPAYLTSVFDNNLLKDAIRVRFSREHNTAAARPFLIDASGSRIRFKLKLSSKADDFSEPLLPRLKLTSGSAVELSPDDAYTQNENGSYTFDWSPGESPPTPAFNPSQVNRLFLEYPGGIEGDGYVEYLITDIEVDI